MDKRIEFAGDDRLQAVEHLWPRFCREVLQFDPEDVMVSDESYITDFREFAFGDDIEAARAAALEFAEDLYARVDAEYFIDVRPLRVIVEILELLQERGVQQ